MDILSAREEFLFDEANIIDACVHQFPDEERWIAELILNSLDAGASEISVSGTEEEERYAIQVNDNGGGMNDTTCELCIEKFSSRKDSSDPYGEFGLGIISPGHDPDQCRMKILSNTRHQRNLILIDGPITEVPRITIRSTPKRNKVTGTTVIVEFNKKKNFSLRKLLLNLYKYSASYLRYVQVPIQFRIPAEDGNSIEVHALAMKRWEEDGVQLRVRIGSQVFEVSISAGKNLKPEVYAYQKRILVSKNFKDEIELPPISYVQIRINSDTWRLPIGRDRIIIDESQQRALSKLRTLIVEQCYEMLYVRICSVPEYEEIIAPIIISLIKNQIYGTWMDYPLIQVYSRARPLLSFSELDEIAQKGYPVFRIRNSKDLAGIDTEKVFPIITEQQSADLLQIIVDRFAEKLHDIKSSDGVYIDPDYQHDHQTKQFLSRLRFDFSPLLDPESLSRKALQSSWDYSAKRPSAAIDNSAAKDRSQALLKELSNIQISLGYLRTNSNSDPNFDYIFYYDKQRLVFNLLHPAVQQLVKYKDPSLAAHRALCLALTDENSGIFNDRSINPLIIDTLLSIDLLARFRAKDKLLQQTMLKRYNDLMDKSK